MIFLGHIFSANRISANTEKVDKVRDWPVPKIAKELHSFLGFGILLLPVYTKLCLHGLVLTSINRSDKYKKSRVKRKR